MNVFPPINIILLSSFISEVYIAFSEDCLVGHLEGRIQKRSQNLSPPLDDAAVQRSNQVHLDTITNSFLLSNFHS
jgi:hypothetical protein